MLLLLLRRGVFFLFLAVLPAWAVVEEVQQAGKLSWRAAVVPVQMWRGRCGSCRETRSVSERGGGGEEVEGALPPSEPLETYPTETWTQKVIYSGFSGRNRCTFAYLLIAT